MNVRVIGVGGIGCCLLDVLARFLHFHHPKTCLELIDGDVIEAKNLHRQSFDQLADPFKSYNKFLTLQGYVNIYFKFVTAYVTRINVYSLIQNDDIVFLCVDNDATRKLVSDRCEDLDNVLLISGGNELTCGGIQVFHRFNGQNLTLPLVNSYHPHIQYPKDFNPGDRPDGCDVAAVNESPQLLFTNNIVAALMLNAFYLFLEKGRFGFDEVYCDIMTANCRAVRRH